MHGYGEFFWPMGKKYYGYYKDDKKHGFGVFFWKDNIKIYIGLWACGKQDGPGLMYFNNGQIKYGMWDDGIWRKWYKALWEFQKDHQECHYIDLFIKDPAKILKNFL
jgi:hypothetical protein